MVMWWSMGDAGVDADVTLLWMGGGHVLVVVGLLDGVARGCEGAGVLV